MMKTYSIKDLKKFDIFKGFTTDQLKMLQSSLYWRTYKKGQFLFVEQDPRDRIYFLLKGYVKLSKINEYGRTTYHDYMKPYKVFPYRGLFSDSTYHFSAEAITDLELFYLPTHIFEELLKRNKHHLIQVITLLSDILKNHESRVQQLPNAQHRVCQTVYHLMLDLGKKDGSVVVIDCPMTTTEIAGIAGTSRETVSQVFKQLKAESVMSSEKKKLIIHKPSFFYEYAS